MPRSYTDPMERFSREAGSLSSPQGKVFVVTPTGSTYNDLSGLYPVDADGVPRLFTDIASALAQTVSGRGDTILVTPGTYTVSTAIAVTQDAVRILGVGGPGAVILAASASNIFTLTGDGGELAGFQMQLATTKVCVVMTGAHGWNIHDNVFTSSVGGAASHFIQMVTTACNYNNIHDNRFISNLVVSGGAITQTSHITGLGIGNIIEHNVFVAGRVTTANTGTVTNGVVFAAAADAGNLVRWNSFTEFNGGIFTAGTNYGTTAVGGSVMCYDNNYMLATAANAVVPGSNAGEFANNIASGTV